MHIAHQRQLGDLQCGVGVESAVWGQSAEAFVAEALPLIAASIAAFDERAR